MKYHLLYIYIVVVAVFFDLKSNNIEYTSDDLSIFSKYIETVSPNKEMPINELIIETGKFFLGTPYIASTLEKDPTQEQLVVNLRELDCTTFLETVFALSLTLKDESFNIDSLENNFQIFCTNLQHIRYRNGEMGNYTSRLHYFSDWIYDNERMSFVQDKTKEIGGGNLQLHVSFMSDHPDYYKQLTVNPQLVKTIIEQEKAINDRTYYYIPKASIAKVKSKIKQGDLIAFTTTIAGLDVSHVGFAIWENNELYLLHASLSGKKVLISKQSLVDYTTSVKRHSGIMVVGAN